MIELVTRAEDFLKARNAWDSAPTALDTTVTLVAATSTAHAMKVLRAKINAVAGAPLETHIENNAQIMAFVRRADLADISQQGPATPQHAVHTKRVPMIDCNVDAYAAHYRAYLDLHLGKHASALIDAAPRIALDPRLGLCAFGKTASDARIAAEMYQHDIAVITRASAHSRYRSAPAAAVAQAEFEYGGYAAQAHRASS